MRKTISFAFIVLLLLLSTRTLQAANIDDLIKKAANPLNSVEDRKKALNELMLESDPRIPSVLSSILRNQEERILIRSYAVDLMSQAQDQWTHLELTKLIKDKTVDSKGRELAIYALWQKNPAALQNDLVEIAQNRNEDIDFRATALVLLRKSGLTKWPPRFWQNLYQKGNPDAVRIGAINGMEDVGIIEDEKLNLIKTIRETNESIPVRKHGILMLERNFASEVEGELLLLFSKSQEPLEIRRFALDHFVNYATANSLPKIEHLLAHEKDPSFKKDLQAIAELLKVQA